MKKIKILCSILCISFLFGCGNNENTSTNISTNQTTSSTTIEGDVITIEEALQIGANAGENGTTQSYCVKGKILNIDNPTFGNMTIKDDTGELFIYGVL